MPALKLFLSHSSRLDDVPHRYSDDDANWRLLRETCEALKAHYGDAIRILVDRDGLIPGDDWNRELNLWLAECQAAIILVSERALKKSDWVAKEAAILGWRRALDPTFTLIPVTIEGESTPADLAQGFFGSLDLGRIQCVHAEHDAQAIVDQIAVGMGDPRLLAGRCGHTPLDQLRCAIAHLLARAVAPAALDAALDTIAATEPQAAEPGFSQRDRNAQALARMLLRASVQDVWGCFDTFRGVLRHAEGALSFEQAKWLFERIRSLWVHPGAAAFLPAALGGKPALSLCGAYMSRPGPNVGSTAYTFDRYVERAWSWPAERPVVVHLTRLDTPAQDVRSMIAEKIIPGHPNPQSEGARTALNRETIVLCIPALPDSGGAPDPRSLGDLTRLAEGYAKLVLVFLCCDPAEALPDGMRALVPPLDPRVEDDAYSAESAATSNIHRTYGRLP